MFCAKSFQMLWVNVQPSLLPTNFHPLILHLFKFPPICYTQKVHLLWWTLGVSWGRWQEWSQESSVSAKSTGHGPNAKVLSNESLSLCLQFYLSYSYNNWHLSNARSFQFSPWDYKFMNYACICRFLTCDRCSMGNFPNILRKPATIPVIDVNEIFPSVYLTLPCHQLVRRCCTRKSVIGGILQAAVPGDGALQKEGQAAPSPLLPVFPFLCPCTWVMPHATWANSWPALQVFILEITQMSDRGWWWREFF